MNCCDFICNAATFYTVMWIVMQYYIKHLHPLTLNDRTYH